jgi:hypothetical protein
MSEEVFEASEENFQALRNAVSETPRGRWFLEEFARRYRETNADDVIGAIDKMTSAIMDAIAPTHVDILKRELKNMSDSIVQTREEIAAIKPDDAGNNRIMAATEELDAIVTATERATTDILGAAERMQGVIGLLREQQADDELCSQIENYCIEIFTACSFQDITGQRTNKVVNVLRYLEQRVNTMIEVWGQERTESNPAERPVSDVRPDAHLINGPQLDGQGVSQSEIDKMLGQGPDDAGALTTGLIDDSAGQEGDNDGPEIDQDEIDALFG